MSILVLPARYLASGARRQKAAQGESASEAIAARQESLAAVVQQFENTLTSKFGVSGTGIATFARVIFRLAKIHPAKGNLNVDDFRIAGLVDSSPRKAGSL